MRISYNWLKEFVDIKVKPQKLADDLSLFGHEVEKLEQFKKDWILDFEITPNRGDCLSILGMAREIAALYNSKFKTQNAKQQFKTQNLNKDIKINISDSKVCSRFTARIIDNIKIQKSPQWLIDRLESYGFRPLNNIIDITNYVMIETGQPLHAFDYDKVKNGKINIRRGGKGESLITLDGQERKLDQDSIIISNNEKIYDLAGIMGGYNSEIDKKTKTIILQGAIFDPILIRRTAKRLKHTTDASYRFERGVDYNGTVYGVNRATELIKKSNDRIQIGQLIDIKSQKDTQKNIKIDLSNINKLLGINLKQNQIDRLLARLNFIVDKNSVSVPSYRAYDVTIWQDIAEEIARLYGYNNLGTAVFSKIKTVEIDNIFRKTQNIKDILYKAGFNEIYSYSFADKKILTMLNYKISQIKEILNPLSPKTRYLRPSIESSLLTAIAKNPWAPTINIFEVGKVFGNFGEKWQIGIATTTKKAIDIKNVLNILNINCEIKKTDQKILDYLKIRKKINYVIIDLNKISIKQSKFIENTSENKYKIVSEYPPTIRDLAFIVDTDCNSKAIKDKILSISKNIFIVELFDDFESEKFGKNKKNVAYHIWMQDINHPMNFNQTNEIIKNVIKKIELKFKAKLRG